MRTLAPEAHPAGFGGHASCQQVGVCPAVSSAQGWGQRQANLALPESHLLDRIQFLSRHLT